MFPIRAGEIRNPQFHSVRFTDREGHLLQEVLSRDESRTLRVPLAKVSPYFRQAMIATEDRRFYDHGGVDGLAALRAALQNLKSGRVIAGGSTITLQLARMLRPAPRTVGSKLRETYRAWRLEAGMSKGEVLEEYLNRVPMGGNLYGVESAARAYFGTNAADLSLAQSSFLAAIPNSPTRLNPFTSRSRVRRRQRHVLSRMAATGAIDAERGELALREKLTIRSQEASFLAPHFVFNLMKELPPGVQTVRTNIDSDLQRLVMHEIRQMVKRLSHRRVTNAAGILLENGSGNVLAYVGSSNFFEEKSGGQNDGVQALRQPGSTLKPFLYGLAFERGFTPASLLADIPVSLPMPSGAFRPKNYSETFLGPVRARVALSNSLNVPAVRLVADLGVAAFLEKLVDFGFTSLEHDADHYGAGLALGDGEVRLEELAGAYLALAAGGEKIPIRKVLAIDGSPAGPGEDESPPVQVLEPRAAFLVTDILSDRYARAASFGVNSVISLPFPCAVKTGTSFRFADNWTVGYSQDYTLAVWTGNFDGSPMQGVSGVSGAGPLFARIMAALYESRDDPPDFPRPGGLSDVTVCSLSGKSPGYSCTGTTDEIIPEERREGFLASPCDIHVDGNTVFPPLFRAWAREAGLEGVPREVRYRDTSVSGRGDGGDFAIQRPADGAIYRRLRDLAPQYQSLLFELRSPPEVKSVQWTLDGEILAVTAPPHHLLWRVTPGGHHLRAVAVAPPGPSDSARFTVH